jgi:hypothetical protein
VPNIAWFEDALKEVREIITEFASEEGIPGGRTIARRIVEFARNPERFDEDPLTEFELFVAVDALGDYGDDPDEPYDIVFQFLRWTWLALKVREPLEAGQRLMTPREIEEAAFHRPRRPLTDRIDPSPN